MKMFLLPLLFLLHTFFETCSGELTCHFEKYAEHALTEQNDTESVEVSIGQCRKLCMDSEVCKSFDYWHPLTWCSLHQQTKDTEPVFFTENSYSNHYQKVCSDTHADHKMHPDFICWEGWVECDNGKCLPRELFCNGNDDCGDLSDEKDCPPVEDKERPLECKMNQGGADYNGTKKGTVDGIRCQMWDRQYPHQHTMSARDFPEGSLIRAENYCRNPDNEPGGPWCYTVDKNIRWQYCNILPCEGVCETKQDASVGCWADGDFACMDDICLPHPSARCVLELCTDCQVKHFYLGANKVDCSGPPPPYTTECKKTLTGREYQGTQSVTRSGHTCQRWDTQYPHKFTQNLRDLYVDNFSNASNYCRNPDDEPHGPWCYTTDPEHRWEYCAIPHCGYDSECPVHGWMKLWDSCFRFVTDRYETMSNAEAICEEDGGQLFIPHSENDFIFVRKNTFAKLLDVIFEESVAVWGMNDEGQSLLPFVCQLPSDF